VNGKQVLDGMGLGMDDMAQHDTGGEQEHDKVQVQEDGKVQVQEDGKVQVPEGDRVLAHGSLDGVRDILASLEEEMA